MARKKKKRKEKKKTDKLKQYSAEASHQSRQTERQISPGRPLDVAEAQPPPSPQGPLPDGERMYAYGTYMCMYSICMYLSYG